jgi:hypothetical protein
MEWQIASARHEWKHGVSSVVRNSELFEIGVVRKSAWFEIQPGSEISFGSEISVVRNSAQ